MIWMATPALAVTVFVPDADSYVDGSSPGSIYGNRTFMRVDASPDRVAYLRFDVSGVGPQDSAMLRLWAASSNDGVTIHQVADNGWSENAITYTNRPAVGAAINATTSPISSGSWIELDVSSFVQGDGTYTFAVTTNDTTALKLDSREGTNSPQLLVPAPEPPTEYVITGSGSSYTATSDTSPPTVFTGTLKFVVESAASDLERFGGGTVTFVAGLFDMGSDHFEFDDVDHIIFRGQGIDVTTLVNNTSEADDTEIFDFVSADHVEIYDMTLSAGGPDRTTSDAIDFDNGRNSIIARVKIVESRGKDIVFDGKGVGWSATGNRVTDCIIENVPGDGIELLASSNNIIEGCTISGSGGHGIQATKASSVAAVPNKPSDNNIIRNNTIDLSGRDGININSGDDNILVGNAISNSSQVAAGRDGIRIESFDGVSCDRNDVESNNLFDNQVVATQRYGVNIADPECTATVIGAANTFSGNAVGDIDDNGTGTILPGDNTPPTTPTNVQASAQPGVVTVTWDASSDNVGVTGYAVYRDGTEVGTVGGTTTTFDDTTVAPETTYSYTVDAFDAAGNRSAQSAPAVVTTPPLPPSFPIPAAADAYVSSSSPTTNFGTSTELRVDGSPELRSYLRFDVTGLTGVVTGVTLRVHAASSHSEGFVVRQVSNTTWDESTITYSNAPLVGQGIGSSDTLTAGSYSEIDITGWVTGDGSYSFALTHFNNTNLRLSSRETANPPQLVITQDTSGNTPPTADDVVLSTVEDTVDAPWAPSVSDPDPDTLTCSIVSSPSNGSAAVSSDCASGTYTPDPDYNGPDSFEYEVSDGSFTDTGVVSVTVDPINDAPVADAQSVATTQDQSITVTLTGSDVDGDCPLTFNVDSPPTNGSLGTITNPQCSGGTASADVQYTPNPGYSGPDSFDVTLTDPSSTVSAAATVSISVTPPQTSFTFNPAADAYVADNAPDNNYGSSNQLRVDGSPMLRSYLRFDVSGLSGSVTSATLRVYANSSHSQGYEAVQVADNGWSESTITFNTAPALGSFLNGSGPATAGTYTDVDVTGYVTGNGTFSFALTPLSNTNFRLASRETGTPPELVIEIGS